MKKWIKNKLYWDDRVLTILCALLCNIHQLHEKQFFQIRFPILSILSYLYHHLKRSFRCLCSHSFSTLFSVLQMRKKTRFVRFLRISEVHGGGGAVVGLSLCMCWWWLLCSKALRSVIVIGYSMKIWVKKSIWRL